MFIIEKGKDDVEKKERKEETKERKEKIKNKKIMSRYNYKNLLFEDHTWVLEGGTAK